MDFHPNIELRAPIMPRSVLSHRLVPRLLWLAAIGLACAESERTLAPETSRPETVWIEIAGEPFELELALDPEARYRGLSRRLSLARNGGMLFANPVPGPMAMVMRDCPIAIDVAFLDLGGRVVAIHEMQPETPRRSDESSATYEARLPVYESGAPAGFAIEVAGGRFPELGLRVGDRVVFDIAGLLDRARRAGKAKP
jgi:uncharacterized membrane protein (UPF0127 family)